MLYLQINTIDDDESRREYKSRIADAGDEVLAIEIPMNENTGQLKRLYDGDELSAYYQTEGGVKNYFITSVVGFREDVIRQVLIRKPREEDISKIQRRDFLRVPAELEISIKLDNELRILTHTEDVGGGGVSFICDKNAPVEMNRQASCWLLLPFKNGRMEHASFDGVIVRVNSLENKNVGMLRFTEIADKERQKIIRFCFERQQILRKN
jgi:c-di-GMP-binding flagellar brake protein YcgR